MEGTQNFDLGGFKVNYGPDQPPGLTLCRIDGVGAGGKVIK